MKLFLASALDEMKEQLIDKLWSLAHKKIAYITNPADEDIAKKWPDLERIKSDRDMLLSCGGELVSVDLRVTQHAQLQEELAICDMIYVSGGDTYYFRQLAVTSGYDALIRYFVKEKWMPYMSTSAGSCIMGSSIKYLEGKLWIFSVFDGFGFLHAMILPHRWSEHFRAHYKQIIPKLYDEQKVLITLTDNQAIWVEDGKIEIVENR